MMKRKVIVQGGGENLYRVNDSNGTFYVQKVSIGLISNNYRDIGRTNNLDDALSIIKSHSGKQIKEILAW